MNLHVVFFTNTSWTLPTKKQISKHASSHFSFLGFDVLERKAKQHQTETQQEVFPAKAEVTTRAETPPSRSQAWCSDNRFPAPKKRFSATGAQPNRVGRGERKPRQISCFGGKSKKEVNMLNMEARKLKRFEVWRTRCIRHVHILMGVRVFNGQMPGLSQFEDVLGDVGQPSGSRANPDGEPFKDHRLKTLNVLL